MSISGVHYDDVSKHQVRKETLTAFQTCQFIKSGDDTNPDGGLNLANCAGINMDSVLQQANVLSQKQADKDKRLVSQLASIQAQIDALQGQINTYNKQIADLDKSIASAQKAIDQLHNGELPPRDADGSFTDKRLDRDLKIYARKHNKDLDGISPDELLAVIVAMQNDQKTTRQDLTNKRDDAQNTLDDINRQFDAAKDTGDFTQVEETLTVMSVNEVLEVAEHGTDEKLVELAFAEDTERKLESDHASHTDTSLDEDTMNDIADNFFAGDDFFASAVDMELTETFTNEAIGATTEQSNELAYQAAAPTSDNNAIIKLGS